MEETRMRTPLSDQHNGRSPIAVMGSRPKRARYIAGALLVASAWIAWPYATVYRLVDAVERGDEATLEQLVDWPAMRAQVREMLVAKLATDAMRSDRTGNGGAAMFGAAMATALIGPMIDNMLTPRMIATARQAARATSASTGSSNSTPGVAASPVATQVNRQVNWDGVRWAAPSGLTTFTVVLGPRADPPSRHVTALFEFRDMGWRLTHIFVPPALLQ